jgi:hypothetical protein
MFRLETELRLAVGFEVDGQTPATALLHQPGTVARFLGQCGPTRVVVPSQIAGRRIEAHKVVLEPLEPAGRQILECGFQPVAVPRLGVPDRLTAEPLSLVVPGLDAEHHAVEGRGLLHLAPVLAKLDGRRDIPAQLDELLARRGSAGILNAETPKQQGDSKQRTNANRTCQVAEFAGIRSRDESVRIPTNSATVGIDYSDS